ncbi:MAG: hypothetical protein LBT89_07655 [Planctomycetaceae bacterium]|jgi:hypothetical protein|nr:hypothetical protein [Planctomycetaceae bacterium]
MRPGSVFALLLIIVSLAANIVYFADFRESMVADTNKETEAEETGTIPVPLANKTESRVNLPIPMTGDPFLQPSEAVPPKVKANTPLPETVPPQAKVVPQPPEMVFSEKSVPAIPKAAPVKPAESVAKQFKPVMRSVAAGSTAPAPSAAPKQYSADAVWPTGE